jgi:asparaginyl-tRNA synthetase
MMATATARVESAPPVAGRLGLIRVWDAMLRGARAYVENQGFVAVHNMPHVVGITGACENIDTLFKTDFFGKQAYLTQTGQLYLELVSQNMRRVYCEIQSFRSEPTIDDRHLCQFHLFEIEHQGNLPELIGHISGIVRNMANRVAAECADVLANYGRNPEDLLDIQFGCMTYERAIAYLRPEFPDLEFGDDLKAHHERLLSSRLGPMFLTHFPMPIKFFNMRQNEQDPRVVNSTDLILPLAGEAAGAAEREHTYDRLVLRLKASPMYRRLLELGGQEEDFAWYLNAHKNKNIPLHSGAGIGVARVAQFLLGLEDIRDAVPFVINRDNLL